MTRHDTHRCPFGQASIGAADPLVLVRVSS
jgi:hypothetical protein